MISCKKLAKSFVQVIFFPIIVFGVAPVLVREFHFPEEVPFLCRRSCLFVCLFVSEMPKRQQKGICVLEEAGEGGGKMREIGAKTLFFQGKFHMTIKPCKPIPPKFRG